MPASHSAVVSPFLCLAVTALACIFSASTLIIHAAGNIPLGSKLSPADATGWVSSPNQLFRLAFYPNPQNSNNFSIGVLYNSAAINTTVVWTAGADIQVGSSGSFEFSTDGDLILKADSGTIVWNSKTTGIKVAASAMQDDGNFVLLNDTSVILWQSFDTPTDTLVVNQTLPQGKNLSAGAYSASMQATGNLTLSYNGNGGYTYWSSGTANGTAPYNAVLENPGRLSIYEQGKFLGGWYSKDYTATTTTPTRRVTLDSDGNLRIYTWSTGSSTPGWAVGWEALEDLCQIYAYCGPNGLCGYNETSVICTCAAQAGYDFNDTRNPRSGCKPIAGNGGLNCPDTATATMVELNNTLLFVSGAENRKFRFGDLDCSGSCLHNSLCTAATPLSDGSGTCQIAVASTFFSGYQELSISTNSYFKYCGSNTPPAGTRSSGGAVLGPALSPGEKKSAVVVSVVVSVLTTLAILALLQVGMWWICCRKNPRWGHYSAHYALMEYASGAPVQLTYKELRRATGNFKEKLGEGGFGAVYKGELPTTSDTGGRGPATEVAVKRLEGLAEHGEKQFRMEMAVIGSTHHMNLVRLCGFCAEGKERLLVYEYMRNGSLDKYLFTGGEAAGAGGSAEDTSGIDKGFTSARTMDWETRFSVLLGTARGITYLHQECRDCIIHSDIKPENILLDDTFTAKVSDFGLAKLTRAHQNPSGHHVTTLVRGTRGYLAPEWRSNLPITVKSDVYSFGVVVLETVSGRKSFAASTRQVSFPEWAYRQYFQHKQVEGVVDERIKEEVDLEQLDRTMKVAFWCVQVQPSARPSMSKVIQMLDGSLAVPQIPPMPKSFGDHSLEDSSTMNEEEDSPMTTLAFEQQSPSYPNTASLSFSHPPTYSLSQSLVSRPTQSVGGTPKSVLPRAQVAR